MEWIDLLTLDEGTLKKTDPLVMNLLVGKGVPALSHIDINLYQQMVDGWAVDFRRWLRKAMSNFEQNPAYWDKGIEHFRLVALGLYLDTVLGVRYREDQRDVTSIRYTDPNDLFLTGILDNVKNGTCGSMSCLYLSMAWRMGWPVSLAMVGWHSICRYDDGIKQFNIETTNTDNGGVSTPPDTFYFSEKYKTGPEPVASGSDLRALQPRELLGKFFGARGRYWYDKEDANLARRDFGLAIQLYPQSRLFPSIVEQTNLMEKLYGTRSQRKEDEGWWIKTIYALSPEERAAVSKGMTVFISSNPGWNQGVRQV